MMECGPTVAIGWQFDSPAACGLKRRLGWRRTARAALLANTTLDIGRVQCIARAALEQRLIASGRAPSAITSWRGAGFAVVAATATILTPAFISVADRKLRASAVTSTPDLRIAPTSTQHFSFAAKRLHNRLIQLGGKAIVNRGLGDKQDSKGCDEELVGLSEAVGVAQIQERFWFAPKFTVTSIGDKPFEG